MITFEEAVRSHDRDTRQEYVDGLDLDWFTPFVDTVTYRQHRSNNLMTCAMSKPRQEIDGPRSRIFVYRQSFRERITGQVHVRCEDDFQSIIRHEGVHAFLNFYHPVLDAQRPLLIGGEPERDTISFAARREIEELFCNHYELEETQRDLTYHEFRAHAMRPLRLSDTYTRFTRHLIRQSQKRLYHMLPPEHPAWKHMETPTQMLHFLQGLHDAEQIAA